MNIIKKYWRIANTTTKIITPILTISVLIGMVTLLTGPAPEDAFLIVTGALFSLTLMENMWHDNLRRTQILTYDYERAAYYFTPKGTHDHQPHHPGQLPQIRGNR